MKEVTSVKQREKQRGESTLESISASAPCV